MESCIGTMNHSQVGRRCRAAQISVGTSAATFRSASVPTPRFVPRWTRVTEKWDARQRIPTGEEGNGSWKAPNPEIRARIGTMNLGHLEDEDEEDGSWRE